MFPFNWFPGTNMHDLDLDWILRVIRRMEGEVNAFIKNWSSPKTVSSYQDFTDPNLIYLYVGSEIGYNTNHWYYYDPDTNAWTDGGLFGSAVVDSALSLTSDNAVKNKVITKEITEMKYYVTPEMYGAVGDGNADDTAAIQAAIDSGKNVIGMSKTYRVTAPLMFDGFDSRVFNLSNSTIKGDLQDFAVKITNAENSEIHINKITSLTSNGIRLYSYSVNDYIQYLQLYINEINIYNIDKVCIEAEAVGAGWVNEISVWNTRLFSSGGGIHLIDGITAYQDGLNNWKFYNIGCEGYKVAGHHLKYGFFFDNVGSATSRDFLIVGTRSAESLDTYIKSNGKVNNVVVVAPHRTPESMFDLSTYSNQWTIIDGLNTRLISYGKFVEDINFGLSGKKLESGADLNTLPCGRFNVPNSSIAGSLVNAPNNASIGNIAVEMMSDIGDITNKYAVIRQTYADINNKTWTRVLTTDGSTPPVISAGNWKEL